VPALKRPDFSPIQVINPKNATTREGVVVELTVAGKIGLRGGEGRVLFVPREDVLAGLAKGPGYVIGATRSERLGKKKSSES